MRSAVTSSLPRVPFDASTAPSPSTSTGQPSPGEVVYRFKEFPGYDYAFEMARLGHASAVIDSLGYGASAIPNGNLVCTGGQADTVHQVIQALRRGEYVFDGSIGGPSFERVALAGHSGGGLIAQVEAYSFHDIDALITMASAFDAGTGEEATPVIFSEIARNGQVCARGGEGKSEDDNPLSGDEEPGGYFYFFRNTPPEFFMHDADPAVVEQVMASWERDPCGTVSSIPTALAADRLHLGSIDVPVLLVFGNEDKTFPADPQGRQQKELFTRSPDVELIAVERAGTTSCLSGWRRTFASGSASGCTGTISETARRRGPNCEGLRPFGPTAPATLLPRMARRGSPLLSGPARLPDSDRTLRT